MTRVFPLQPEVDVFTVMCRLQRGVDGAALAWDWGWLKLIFLTTAPSDDFVANRFQLFGVTGGTLIATFGQRTGTTVCAAVLHPLKGGLAWVKQGQISAVEAIPIHIGAHCVTGRCRRLASAARSDRGQFGFHFGTLVCARCGNG